MLPPVRFPWVPSRVKWGAGEVPMAVQRLYGGAIGRTRARLTERRSANIAAARKLLTLVFYGLRDGRRRRAARRRFSPPRGVPAGIPGLTGQSALPAAAKPPSPDESHAAADGRHRGGGGPALG